MCNFRRLNLGTANTVHHLVARRLLAGGKPPVVHHLVALKNTQNRVGVTHIHRERYRIRLFQILLHAQITILRQKIEI